MVRYSKVQRPTSLPIQPFVLVPAGNSQAQHLGSLLEQYTNQRNGKSASSQPGSKFKGKRSQCFSNLQVSPMGSHYPVFLEAPSSSDTCSTCTPSPVYLSRRHTWSQSNRNQGRFSPCATRNSLDPTYTCPNLTLFQDAMSPNSGKPQTNTLLDPTPTPSQSNCDKNSIYQDIIHLTPEQIHVKFEYNSQDQTNTSYYSGFSHMPPTSDTHPPNLQMSMNSQPQKKVSQDRAASADDSGFLNSFTAALLSVAPLSSLTSLLSCAASGLDPQQVQDFGGLGGKASLRQHSESLIVNERPPTEFCLSPDACYESMSISHLQRRGEAKE